MSKGHCPYISFYSNQSWHDNVRHTFKEARIRDNAELPTHTGPCLVHDYDSSDGRILILKTADEADCLNACVNAVITNCRYTDMGTCTYQLKIFPFRNSNDETMKFNCGLRHIGTYHTLIYRLRIVLLTFYDAQEETVIL